MDADIAARVQRVGAILDGYGDDGSEETAVRDLLADLMHFCEHDCPCFETELEAARQHYAVESQDATPVVTKEVDHTTYYQIDGYWVEEKYVCKRCLSATHAVEAEERTSFGCYAGRYCDTCWPKSGFRDAVDPTVRFDPMDAGEALYEEDY